jgi:hypothetical protein
MINVDRNMRKTNVFHYIKSFSFYSFEQKQCAMSDLCTYGRTKHTVQRVNKSQFASKKQNRNVMENE